MFRLKFIFTFFIMLVSASMVFAVAVKDIGEGMYRASYNVSGGFIHYIVDTKAQLCFVSSGGMSTISCDELANRPEWKEIITWVNK